MSTEYKKGLVIQDDGNGGIEVITAIDDALNQLDEQINKTTTNFKTLTNGLNDVVKTIGNVGNNITSSETLMSKLDEQTKQTNQQFKDLKSSLNKTGGEAEQVAESVNKTEGALEQLDEQSKSSAQESDTLKGSFSGIIDKVGVVGNAVGKVIDVFASFASMLRHDAISELGTLSGTLDISLESLSSWDYAAKTVGLSTKDFGKILKDTTKKIGEASTKDGSKAKAMFDDLGLSVDELKQLNPDQQLLAIADSMDKLGSQGEKVFYLESLSGDATKLLPLLSDGAEGLRKMEREADLLGSTLDNTDAAQVAAISDTFRVLGGAAEGFATQLTVAIAPAFTGLSDKFLDFLEVFGGMENIVETVVSATVDGIAFVLDYFHFLDIALTTAKLGWLKVAELAVGAMADSADAVAQLINLALAPLTTLLAEITDGWGYILIAAGSFMGEAGKGLKDVGQGLQDFAEKTRDFTVDAEDIRAAQESVKDMSAETADELVRLRGSAPGAEFRAEFEANKLSVEGQSNATQELADSNNNAKEGIDNASEALNLQTGAIEDQVEAKDKDATATSNQAKAKGEDAKSIQEQADAKTNEAKSTQSLADAKNNDAEATGNQKDELNKYAEAWEKALANMDEAFADGWLDLIQGNATDVFDSVLDGFKTMLADMAHQAITQPIILEFQQSMKEGGGGLSGFLDGNSIGGVFESFGSYIGDTFGTSNIFEGAGEVSNLSMGGAGILGGLFGSTAGGMGAAGGSAGAMIGMALGFGPLGAAIGGVLGSAVGSLFGGSWENIANELQLNYSGVGGFSGQHYTKEKKKKLWKNRYRENYSSLDAELANPLSAYFQTAEDTLRVGADLFGIDEVTETTYRRVWEDLFDEERGRDFYGQIPPEFINDVAEEQVYQLEDWLDNFSAKMTLNLDGMDEAQVQTAIDNWARTTTDNMMSTVFGDFLLDMQNQGESLTDTLTRVIAQLEIVGSAFDVVNISLEQLAGTSAQLQATYADDVLRAAGGEEALSQLLNSYQSAYFSEEEILTKQLGDLASVLLGQMESIGFTYGDDFRSQFEAAQASGLAAEELVRWLQTGNMLTQFEAIAEQLAGVTEGETENIIANMLANSNAITVGGAKLDKEDDGSDVSATVEEPEPDPVASEVIALNEAINEQVGGSNERLDTIDQRLVEVNDSIKQSFTGFTDLVTHMLADNSAAIKALRTEVATVAASASEASHAASNMIKDVARLAIDLRPKGEPVITTEVL